MTAIGAIVSVTSLGVLGLLLAASGWSQPAPSLERVVAHLGRSVSSDRRPVGASGSVPLGLIGLIGRALGKDPVVDEQPSQAGDVRCTYADISRARSEIGYAPSILVEEGVPKFVEWFRQEMGSR